MSTYTHEQLSLALKTAALTFDQIKALDPGPICQSPAIALQVLRSRGHQITATTNASTGAVAYQITA